MRDEYFDLPVTVTTSEVGRFYTVTRVEQAAEMLVKDWPSKGPKHRAAIQAMVDFMEQRAAVSQARKAFTAAAKEAKRFIREGYGP